MHITEDLRSMLFVSPGNVAGLDLAVFNIQRGRDLGLPDYNSMKEAYGLPRRAYVLGRLLRTSAPLTHLCLCRPTHVAAWECLLHFTLCAR